MIKKRHLGIVLIFTMILNLLCGTLVVDAKEVALSEKDKLSIFLSNFAETGMGSFTERSLKDADMVEFGIMHNYLNYSKKFKEQDGNIYITQNEVAKVIQKYFNKKPKNFSSRQYKLKNGCYIVPMASGGAFPCAKVDKIKQVSKDIYEVSATAYVGVNSFFTAKDIVKPVEQLKKEYGDYFEACDKITARVKKLKDRYIILDYKVTKI